MKILLGLLAIYVAVVLAPVAAAKPIEVKSKNFVFIGDVNQSDAKALVTELEQYRTAILQLFGGVKGSEPIPVRIYTVKNKTELKKITGRIGIAGIYTTNLEGPIFILNSKNGFRRGKQARHIALHEYTHHMLASYTDNYYPRWYNEGFANYLSTFEVDKRGRFIIGKPYNPYAIALSQKKWMPTNVVVNSVRKYPYKSNQKTRGLNAANYFYAQSWLAVHYLQSKGDPKKLKTYIKTLNTERRPENVFEKSFGMTPDEFHKILKSYYKANKFNVMTITPKVKIQETSLQVRVLEKGEAAFHKAEAMRFLSADEVSTADVRAQYDKAAKKLGETALVLAARAELATWDNDYDNAQALIDKALTMAPDDPNVGRMAGMILIYKNEAADNVDRADMKRARRYLKQALRANADDVGAHYHYVKTYALSKETPSKQAVASARSALDYYRSNNFSGSNLMLVDVLMRAKRYGSVRGPIEKAIVWGGKPGTRLQARTMKRYLDKISK